MATTARPASDTKRSGGDLTGRSYAAREKPGFDGAAAIAAGAAEAPGRSRLLAPQIRILRLHQWSKNILVFAALVSSHHFTATAFAQALAAFVAFSLCASAAYIVNDLVDVAADRAHPVKRDRPLASAALPIAHGIAIAPLLLMAAAAVALWLPLTFGVILAAYVAVNLCYSLILKRKMLVDVITLAGLYTLRVFAGAAAIGVSVSEWLLAFSMFIFLALALVKRHSELVLRLDAGMPDPDDRDYRAVDRPVLIALAAASGFAAVVVFALYVSSPAQLPLYHHARRLYLICPLFLYWFARILMRSNRGELPDDPVVFALKDPVSLATAALTAIVIAAATYP